MKMKKKTSKEENTNWIKWGNNLNWHKDDKEEAYEQLDQK